MQKQVAEDICGMADEIFSQMQTLNNYVIENCDRAYVERVVHALTLCVAELDLEILEPVYRKYPELKPAFLP